jgi:hypothetical protein
MTKRRAGAFNLCLVSVVFKHDLRRKHCELLVPARAGESLTG